MPSKRRLDIAVGRVSIEAVYMQFIGKRNAISVKVTPKKIWDDHFTIAIPAWYSVLIDINYIVPTLVYPCLQGQALSVLMQTAAWTSTISKNAIP